MKTHSMKHRNSRARKAHYPVDLDQLATDLEQHGIDIAPTLITWLNLARCIAGMAGEQGREAFHRIAAVWPDYSRHDSELCYDRALRRHSGPAPGISYLAKACRCHGIDLMSPRYRAKGKPVITMGKPKQRQDQETMPTPTPIRQEVLETTLPAGRNIVGRCPLTDLLLNIFPRERVLKAIDDYLVGFESLDTRKIDNSILYWQVNNQGEILNAKRIYYKAGGHRDKKVPPMLIWSHRPQCLYGLHRYSEHNRHMPVAIVESEKSAIIMSIVQPGYLWMATGSLNNFNERFLEPVKQAHIIAYPDVDYQRDKRTGKSASFELWNRTAIQLNRKGWNIRLSNVLEDMASTPQRMDKIDVTDVAIEHALQEFISSNTRKP